MNLSQICVRYTAFNYISLILSTKAGALTSLWTDGTWYTHRTRHLIRDANCVWVRVLALMFMTCMLVWIMCSLCKHIFHHMQRAVFPKCCHNVLCITNNTLAINEHLPTRTELHTILLSPPTGSVCQSWSLYVLTWVELLVIIISHWANQFSID